MTDVSVIIPSFNRARFLPACVASVLSGGIRNVEIVVADDGSTDDTEAVVRSFAGRVRYLRQANAGPAAARNLGTLHSTGRYLCFLDSDDCWLPGAPAKLFEALAAHPARSVAFGDAQMGNDDSGYVSFVETYGGSSFRDLPSRTIDTDLHVLERSAFFRQLAIRNVMFLGSMLIQREAFDLVGGFDRSLRGAADWDLFLRLAARFEIVYMSAPPVSQYLKHDVAMSNDSEHMNTDFMLALAHVLEVADGLGDAERAHVRRLLKRHRFDHAYVAYDSGRLDVARRRFLEAARLSGLSVRVVAYLMLSCAPQAVVDRIRRVRRRVLR